MGMPQLEQNFIYEGLAEEVWISLFLEHLNSAELDHLLFSFQLEEEELLYILADA